MLAILLLAFPVALILAWAFEVTPDGVQKTEAAGADEIEAIVAQPAVKRWGSGLLALLGVVALLGSGWWIGRRSAPGADGPGSETRLALGSAAEDNRPTIAVFPFADMSPKSDQEYFSDGISEELLSVLAKIRELKVTARTSAFALKGQDLTAEQLGDTLRVRYLVEGSVRKAGDQLRITAQLIDASDGSHLWSEQYDRRLADVFAIQTEIAEAIAAELRVPLGLDEGEQLVTPTADLQAYDLYLAGRARMRERGASVFEAVELFEAAVARDSTWAPAWAGLAESRALVPWYSPGPIADAPWAESLAAAERAANRALALDPNNASALVALGVVHRDRWEWDQAEAAFTRALNLDPDNVEAHQQYAEYFAYTGRLDEALRSARRALDLDRASIRLNVAGYISIWNGRYDEAIALHNEGIRLEGQNSLDYNHRNRLRAYATAGRWAKVREGLLAGDLRSGEDLEELARLWPASEAMPPAAVAEALSRSDVTVSVAMWMALEEPGRAMDVLDGFARRMAGSRVLFWAPFFDPLQDDPRFQELLRAGNLGGRRPVRAPPD